MTKEEIEEKYGLTVKNGYTIGNWKRAAARQGLSLEEYLQSLSDRHREEEATIKVHQDLCIKYGIKYISEVQFARFIEAANRNNMSLDEWVASVAETQRPKVQENHHQEWMAFVSSVPDLVVVDLQGPNDMRYKLSCKEWVCDICGSHYIAGVTDGLNRGKDDVAFHVCSMHVFYQTCDLCGKQYERKLKKITNEPHYCSLACASLSGNEAGICVECGQHAKIRANSRCLPCRSKLALHLKEVYKGPGKCSICQSFSETRDINSRGYDCGCAQKAIMILNTSEIMIEQTRNLGKTIGKYNLIGLGHASLHGVITPCEKNHKSTLSIYIHGGFHCWECYKEKFMVQNETKWMKKIMKEFKNAYLQCTFRDQQSEDWTGARTPFEQSLKERVNYFVYVKFYVAKNGHSLPIVVGYSGSLAVNRNGSDVNFSTDVNDGNARKFLHEEKLHWDKRKILVIPAQDIEDAKKIESYLQEKYHLFGS